MLTIIYTAIFLAIPAAVVVLWGVSLYLYVSASKKNKQNSDTFSAKELKNRMILLIVLSVMVAALLVMVIGLITLMFLVINFM